MQPNITRTTLLVGVPLAGFLALGANGGSCQKRANVGDRADGASGGDADANYTADTSVDTNRDTGRPDTGSPDTGGGTDTGSSTNDTGTKDTGTVDSGGGDADGGNVQCPSTPKPGSGSCEWKRVRWKNDFDSQPDWDLVNRRTYDAKGRVVRGTEDMNADGTTDTVRVWKYDKCGRKRHKKSDTDTDGNFEIVKTWSYSGGWHPTGATLENDGDNTPEVRWSFKHDSNGNRLVKKVDGREDRQADVDGRYDDIYRWSYNSRGDVVRYTYDDDGDGTIEYEETKKYDSQNRVTREIIDGKPLDANGPTEYHDHIYKTNPRRDIEKKDFDADGDPEDKVVVRLDSKDRVVKNTLYIEDRANPMDYIKSVYLTSDYPTWNSSKRIRHVKGYGWKPREDGKFDGNVDRQWKTIRRCK